jgi:hypothetical protein
MNFTPETIELIVQRVLEHLGTPAPGAPTAASAAVAPAVPVPRGFRISAQVVTQAVLAESINGSTTVRIGPKAIVTPSALDFVRQRGIEIVRESATLMSTAAARWQVIVTTSHPHIAPAVDGLQQYGIKCDSRLSGLPAEAAAQATSAICRGDADKVIVFTAEPELVACLANRNERIRAAAIGDAAALARTQRELKPNVLTLDPSNRSVHEIRTLLKAF